MRKKKTVKELLSALPKRPKNIVKMLKEAGYKGNKKRGSRRLSWMMSLEQYLTDKSGTGVIVSGVKIYELKKDGRPHQVHRLDREIHAYLSSQ